MSKDASDPNLVFEMAERFREATNVLDAEYSHGSTTYCSSPSIVLDAFSVELYLKCLLLLDHDRKPIQEHRFNKLYAELNEATQLDLRLQWHLNIQKDPVLRHLGVINPNAPPLDDFSETIRVGSDAFMTSRYLFESKNGRRQGWFYSHLLRECVRDVARARLDPAMLPNTGDIWALMSLQPQWIAITMPLVLGWYRQSR